MHNPDDFEFFVFDPETGVVVQEMSHDISRSSSNLNVSAPKDAELNMSSSNDKQNSSISNEPKSWTKEAEDLEKMSNENLKVYRFTAHAKKDCVSDFQVVALSSIGASFRAREYFMNQEMKISLKPI